MNKKLFTLFLVVAASAIFAVSCNNKTTDPVKDSNTGTTTESTPTGGDGSTPSTPTTPTTPEVKKTAVKLNEVEDAIKKLATVTSKTDEDTVSFADAKITDGKIALTVKDKSAGGDSKIKAATLKTALEEALKTLSVNGLVISNDADSFKPTAAGKKPASINLTLKPADDKHELDKTTFEAAKVTVGGDGSAKIVLEFTPEQNWEE